MYISSSYLLLIFVSLVLGLGTQFWISSRYKKWSKSTVMMGTTGAQAARQMLDAHGLQHVPINVHGGGEMSDYYDPRADALYLSEQSFYNSSVADISIACHEAGHAVQHAHNYAFANLRQLLVPIVSFGSNTWIIVFLIGIFINATGLITLGIILFAFTVLFQFVTLPVEFDASKRALDYITGMYVMPEEQQQGARSVLVAAALTYVAAALVSVLQLLYLLGARNR